MPGAQCLEHGTGHGRGAQRREWRTVHGQTVHGRDAWRGAQHSAGHRVQPRCRAWGMAHGHDAWRRAQCMGMVQGMGHGAWTRCMAWCMVHGAWHMATMHGTVCGAWHGVRCMATMPCVVHGAFCLVHGHNARHSAQCVAMMHGTVCGAWCMATRHSTVHSAQPRCPARRPVHGHDARHRASRGAQPKRFHAPHLPRRSSQPRVPAPRGTGVCRHGASSLTGVPPGARRVQVGAVGGGAPGPVPAPAQSLVAQRGQAPASPAPIWAPRHPGDAGTSPWVPMGTLVPMPSPPRPCPRGPDVRPPARSWRHPTPGHRVLEPGGLMTSCGCSLGVQSRVSGETGCSPCPHHPWAAWQCQGTWGHGHGMVGVMVAGNIQPWPCHRVCGDAGGHVAMEVPL